MWNEAESQIYMIDKKSVVWFCEWNKPAGISTWKMDVTVICVKSAGTKPNGYLWWDVQLTAAESKELTMMTMMTMMVM